MLAHERHQLFPVTGLADHLESRAVEQTRHTLPQEHVVVRDYHAGSAHHRGDYRRMGRTAHDVAKRHAWQGTTGGAARVSIGTVMSSRPITDRLEEQSVLVIECSIPIDATIAEWRRSLPARPSPRRAPARFARRLHRRAARIA
jgi:hypothetical protein